MQGCCFSFFVSSQLRVMRGELINICHHHPLAAYWRDRFCEAVLLVDLAEVWSDQVLLFCSDTLYYQSSGGLRSFSEWNVQGRDCVQLVSDMGSLLQSIIIHFADPL